MELRDKIEARIEELETLINTLLADEELIGEDRDKMVNRLALQIDTLKSALKL